MLELVNVFRARVVDVGPESLTIEITGAEAKIDGLLEVLRPYGILEMVRTGIVAMRRGAKADEAQVRGIASGNGAEPHSDRPTRTFPDLGVTARTVESPEMVVAVAPGDLHANPEQARDLLRLKQIFFPPVRLNLSVAH